MDPFGIVGQVLDSQFRVDKLVGEGGFSAVYRGHHLSLDEPIAIKCLKLPPSLSPELVDEFAKRFRDESRILYRLSQGNLNIVRSIAAGTWTSKLGFVVPFMTLEWMEGRSLANEFTIRRTVGQTGRPLSEVVKLFGSAADGLAYAHSQGVVHRDLNPGNFFLAASPQGTRMKVLDFGVAKILDDSTLNIARTQTVGQIRIFAPAYGAPEQFDDAIGKVSAATDVYAFALILLEALRDRSVNDGQHLGEFAQKALDPQKRPTPRSLGLTVTDEVELIFARATKLDPRERWQSARELWQALAIAASAASQERHAQAAKETPPLDMPQPGRTTQAGMAPPQQPQKTQDRVRMEKTLPIGAVMPNVASQSTGGAQAADASEPEEDPTRVGRRVVDPVYQEPEDEPTKVRAPEPDMLRAGGGQKGPVAGPPAGAPPQGAFPGAAPTYPMHSPTQQQPAQQPPSQPQVPHAKPGGALAMTMPLTGPHPLGLQGPQGPTGPAPAAGAPPTAHYPAQQPPQQQPPQQAQYPAQQLPATAAYPAQQPQQPYPGMQQQQQHPHQSYPSFQGPAAAMPGAQPGAYAQQHQHQQQHPGQAHSVSMAPSSVAGVPKKSSPILFIGIGFGVLALVGIGLIAVALSGKSEGKGTTTSTSASAAASTIASASAPPPPPPPAPTETAPVAAVVEDASTTAEKDEPVDAGSASASASAAATATATATATTPPTPPPSPFPTAPVNPTPPSPVAVKDAGPPPDPNAFSESVARSKLSQANGVLPFCSKKDGVNGPGSAMVTFSPEGTVTSVAMNPPYAGTPVGECVAGQLKRVKTNSFKGDPKTIKHSFDVPK